jgi:hypothetical protein
MRIYDTPTHWHEEPDIDPVFEENMIYLYGENWKEILKERENESEYEFYTFPDDDDVI